MWIDTRGTPRVAWTQKTQKGVRYDSAHHLKDFREPWRAPQGVENYIYKIYVK
jgi:hypothetical protein